MRCFLFTNAPDCPVECRAIWFEHKEAKSGLKAMKHLEYYRLYQGKWSSGFLPVPGELFEVHISEFLAGS
jgi:hypothetical protein